MTRTVSVFLVLAAMGAAGMGGWQVGRHGLVVPGLDALAFRMQEPVADASGPVIYYRDPDGQPLYSLEPRQTEDGRAWIAVHAREDISFDDAPSSPAATPGNAPPVGRKLLYYRNPMGLPDTSPVPKKDSMGMDYLPVYEGDDGDGTTVTVSPGRLQRSGVRSEKATRRVLETAVRAPGTIQLDERRISVVSLRSEGFIEQVADVTTGRRVREGQPLFRVYSPEIAAAAAQFLSGIGQAAGTGVASNEGARRRLENLGVPSEVMAEIARMRKVPLTIAWPAPRDGVVLERAAVNGMRAMPGDVLFRLADLSTVWALIDVAERDLPLIASGQKVTVRPRGYPDVPLAGHLALIYPQIGSATRTVPVRVELPNPEGLLKSGMYVDAEISTGEDAPVLTIPASAVIDSGTRQIVLLDQGEGRFAPRPVTIGRRNGDVVEVREGLVDEDRVVVSATFLIDAESNLKAALRAFSSAETSQP